MRIAILSDPENFHTRKWYRALSQAGADPSIFSFSEYKEPGLNTIHIPPPLKFGNRFFYPSYLAAGKRLEKSLRKEKIEVLNPLNITPFGVWAAKSGFHPLISCAFGADILEFPPRRIPRDWPAQRSWNNIEGNLQGIKKIRGQFEQNFFRKKVKMALDASDAITGDNQHLVDCIQQWFGIKKEKVKLIRWGVEEELFAADEIKLDSLRKKFRIPLGKKIILAPRGAKSIYQADIILKAVQLLLQNGRSDLHFVLFSAGYEISTTVNQLAEELGKTGHFSFIKEMIPREDVYAFWNLVDIFISAPVYDGYSASLAEGRYIGAIPVVNKIPANEELITHMENGWICDPFSTEKLASDLDKILTNLTALKNKFSTINRKWIIENSLMKNSAKQFMRLCEELLAAKKKGIL